MIKLFSGTPGSGKSLHTAEKIYYALRAGRPVICNFDINVGFVQGRKKKNVDFTYIPNDSLDVGYLVSFASSYFADRRMKEEWILLVIDEAQLMFNAREWDAKGRKEWLSFFTQHRKYGYEIILVAQFDRMLDRQIRSLIEYEYIHRKVSNFGAWGKIFSVVFLGKLFVAVQMWYPLHERIHAEWFVCKPRFFRLYDTYKNFSDYEKSDKKASDAAVAGADPAPACVMETDSGVKFYEIA